ncbi:hypothetical protein [Haladaptatus caseinilyticus]|uniref:hypothetical protein n=1 Tax=Haladaptatus caseinilyticus TaxID=2993314 RepID=UPI00224B4A19|nr:hypothetical protein [Haladaptatus caseinilyticus]
MSSVVQSLKKPYTRNVLEVIGASLLALIFIGPLIYAALGKLISFGLDLFGITQPLPLLWINVVFISSIFITVWAVFKVVEFYYQR